MTAMYLQFYLWTSRRPRAICCKRSPCKPVTIFGQVYPGSPWSPLQFPGWAPLDLLGLWWGGVGWVVGYVLGWVGYPVVPHPLLFGQLPQALTCLCLFVCYWLTMEDVLLWENHFWTRPHMTHKRWGVICNKVEDSFSSEKEFSISWQHLPGFMWPMKRGKEGTLPDN